MMARNMKRRGTGSSPQPHPDTTPEPVIPDGAPYDPVSVPVRRLPAALASLDAEQVRALQSVDPRTSAAPHYESRLNELADG